MSRRPPNGLKRSTSQRAKTAKKSAEGHVSRRCTQQKICTQVNQPSMTITNPLTMHQVLPLADGVTTEHAPPILLDESAVPRGQMLPVCQDQFLSASCRSMESNRMNPTSAFMNPTSCVCTAAAIGHTCLPQMGTRPSLSQALWDGTDGLVNPVAPLSMNFGQTFSPPEQTAAANLITPTAEQSCIDSALEAPTDGVSGVDFTDQPLASSSVFQSAPSSSDGLTAENRNKSVSDVLCDLRLLQESDLCSGVPLTDRPQAVDGPFCELQDYVSIRDPSSPGSGKAAHSESRKTKDFICPKLVTIVPSGVKPWKAAQQED